MILFIDNFDSFTYNLVQMFGSLGEQVKVVRNHAVGIDFIHQLNPHGIVISPGPGDPAKAGISIEVIKKFHKTIPILGVCLGHQCIAEAFGGKIIRGEKPIHGKTSEIFHTPFMLYQNIPSPFLATRYHSLIVENASLPPLLQINAYTQDNVVMGIHHVMYPVIGIQFHPESILTSVGKTLIQNWLTYFVYKDRPVSKQRRSYGSNKMLP